MLALVVAEGLVMAMSGRVLSHAVLALALVPGAAVTSTAAPAAAAASPPGYRVVSDQELATGNNYDTAAAYCPSNMAVVGGGYATTGGAMTLTELDPVGVNGWTVFVYNSSPQQGTVTAYAECSSRVRNDRQPAPVSFYPPAHSEATRTRSCAGVALAAGAEGSSQSVPVNRITFGTSGTAVTGGVYNSSSQVGWAYLFRLCASRPHTVVRRHTVHGGPTSRIVIGQLRCPSGTAFTQAGFAMTPARTRVLQSHPVANGTAWTVTARFPHASRSNTLTISGACIT